MPAVGAVHSIKSRPSHCRRR